MYILSQEQGLLVHAAGISMHDKGYIFPGRSGAGKSTLARLLASRDTASTLSDDRIIIRKRDNAFKAYGTPWPGEAGIAENVSDQLHGIFFIHHAGENRIKEVSSREALNRLLPVASIPWYDEKPMSDILKTCEDLVCTIPAYELHFTPDSSVADFLEKFLAS
jgi:serine kinase of HPr protein (carbohydrate metabolism regulator)